MNTTFLYKIKHEHVNYTVECGVLDVTHAENSSMTKSVVVVVIIIIIIIGSSFELLRMSYFSDNRLTVDEDMDISPGSTPTEESLLEKRLNAIGGSADRTKSVTSVLSPVVNQISADRGDDPCLFETLPTKNSSPSSATFLSTLTSLQQALHHVTPAGNSSVTKSVPSSTLNLLASLPSLVNQLQEAERDSSATAVTSQYQQSNQQHVLQQGWLNSVFMLQKSFCTCHNLSVKSSSLRRCKKY